MLVVEKLVSFWPWDLKRHRLRVNVTEGINKQMTKESLAANLGGGAEAESFSKTLTQIHMTVQPKQLLVVILVGGFILSLVSLISSRWLLHKKPKDLLVDVE